MVISLVNICTGGGFRNFATLTNTIYIMKRFLLLIALISAWTTNAAKISYTFKLLKCDISKNGNTISSDNINAENLTYTDSLINVSWDIDQTQFNFVLSNNTKTSIKIIWDDAVYIDYQGSIDKVMHKGVKYIDRQEHQPNSNIPNGAKIDDLMIPISNIFWRDGHNGIGAGWQERPLLPHKSRKWELDDLRTDLIGKNIGVTLPIIVGDNKYEYTFYFEIIDISMKK